MDETAGPPDATTGKKTLASRALSGSLLSVAGFGGGQILRLASNLILTRILSPDDFGLMALVTSFLIGLTMFSDMGLQPSIQQSKRGDDPDFLDTAWSIKVIRGAILLGVACVLAWPLAVFYDAPRFAAIFPVAAISLLIAGFNPTRIDTATRHMFLGRLTAIEIASQALGILIMIFAAWMLQSVWALVVGNVASALSLLLLSWWLLPGHVDRFRMEPTARHELVQFGKWIFLSTICGFLLFQGDRLILGRVLTMRELGIYNIALYLGTVPMLLGGAIAGRLFIPMYRQHPPNEDPANLRMLAKARAGVAALLVFGITILALVGPQLVQFLYDPRYTTAGGLLVLIALLQLPQVILISYDYAALAAGDTRGFFLMQSSRAALYFLLVSVGAWLGGLEGVLIGQAAAYILVYPIVVSLARKHRAWDPVHDAVIAVGAVILIGVAYTLHHGAVATALAQSGGGP